MHTQTGILHLTLSSLSIRIKEPIVISRLLILHCTVGVVLRGQSRSIGRLPIVRSTSTNASSNRIPSHMNENKRLKMDTPSGPGIVTHS